MYNLIVRIYFFEYTDEHGRAGYETSLSKKIAGQIAEKMAKNPLVKVGPVRRTRHVDFYEPDGPISASGGR